MSYEKYVVNEHSYYKTYSTASEAFKDADYASPLWVFESNNSKALRYVSDKFGGFMMGLAVGLAVSLFI